jgi:1-aminocyclopropane-1-carboxylate deaminase/D-cysteine desulfhydrase-like pyridoxal-dependent ACC family enzyme
MRQFFSPPNEHIVSSSVNKTFEQLHFMTDKQFDNWMRKFCKEAIHAWDKLNMPPVKGISEREILRQYETLRSIDTDKYFRRDEQSYETDCIVNTSNVVSAVNAFFPNIGKVKDITSGKKGGVSLYDCLKNPDSTQGFRPALLRNFKHDSKYVYSKVVCRNHAESGISTTSGKKWIVDFVENKPAGNEGYDFWIDLNKGSGRSADGTPLYLRKADIEDLISKGVITKQRHLASIESLSSKTKYRIRLYDTKTKLFPVGFGILRTLLIMPATNFPPGVAKFIYNHFTRDIDSKSPVVIYDPSAGFGGRLFGALSMNDGRKYHYIGTDPNTENWLSDDLSRYAVFAEHFKNSISGTCNTSYELYQLGSEVIHKNKDFKKHKGKVDFAFTSPPYFAAEGYSQDATQSYLKFPTYPEWRDGFLKQTLQTAYDYLRNDRWLVINIADVAFDGKFHPLEQDTINLCKEIGFEYRGKLKMVLPTAPGRSMNKRTRLPTSKNFCRVNDTLRKYEPVFMFWKGKKKGKRTTTTSLPPKKTIAKKKKQSGDTDKYGMWNLTPVEEHNGIYYKRDDSYKPIKDNPLNGGKVRQAISLISTKLNDIRSNHNNTVITATGISSPQGAIITSIAKEFGCKSIICVGGTSPESIHKKHQMRLVQHLGGEVRNVAGHGINAVLEARVREIVSENNAFNISFGIAVKENAETILETTSYQVQNLPDELDNLVVPVGSGIQLSGILIGLYRYEKKVKRVIGVCVGPTREKTIDDLASSSPLPYELISAATPYSKSCHQEFAGNVLDETYEAKAHEWMMENIDYDKEKTAFWVIGCKLSAKEVDAIVAN